MRQAEIDQALAILQEAGAAGAYTENQLQNFRLLVAAAQESDAALRQVGDGTDDGFVLFQIADYMGDLELTLDTGAADWNSVYPREPFYFSFSDARVYRKTLWKDQIRQSGVLDLWRS